MTKSIPQDLQAEQEHHKPIDLSIPILTFPNGLSVRCYRHSDAASIAKHCNNRAIWRNMRDTFPHPYTLDSAHDWISLTLDTSSWRPTAPGLASTNLPTSWVVALDDQAIGSIGLIFRGDVQARTAEVGYWIGQEHWGKGYAGMVVGRFVEWVFETYRWLIRLEADIFHWNPASMSVVKKAGLGMESIQRAAVWKDGKVVDVHIYVKVRDGVRAVY